MISNSCGVCVTKVRRGTNRNLANDLVRRRISPSLWEKSAAVRLDSLAGGLSLTTTGAEFASILLVKSGYRVS